MCLLAIVYRAVERCPVLVAANREESYERQGTEPQLWPGEPAIVAGRDPRAGGTWLGVNQHGVLAAVTNRPKRTAPPEPRSRGLLCRDLLSCRTAREAHERALAELDRKCYAGCNVLAIDAAAGYVVHAGELLRSSPLPVGIHVVTASDLNDPADRRIVRARDWLTDIEAWGIEEWLAELPRVCRDHGRGPEPPLCLHLDGHGTVSSSIIALAEQRHDSRWLHSQGPPCSSPFVDCSHLLGQLFR
jgi:uncharacterized protein with NRDE domain